MKAGAVAIVLSLATCPAQADGPALAHLTIDGRTLTLSADNDASAHPMIHQDGTTLSLRFAQLHLGFPMPPILTIRLIEDDAGWHVDHIDLQQTGGITPALGPPHSVSVTGTGLDRQFTVAGEALAPDATGAIIPMPYNVEVSLRSP
ncbi:hypothetical protein [Hasllibacter sp. MH4015]|uniref:hypothetical protein n=1 Tax=Hasllibacter sp. MH4015 TaxID=2854029 RepID=UPI001CD550AA|nr:hypothetical protein [Hasllibacter sp. MH4015]